MLNSIFQLNVYSTYNISIFSTSLPRQLTEYFLVHPNYYRRDDPREAIAASIAMQYLYSEDNKVDKSWRSVVEGDFIFFAFVASLTNSNDLYNCKVGRGLT